ncbi:PAS domain S-box-containing protein [Micromonospora kangleipakensis]|uniref:histidine kinase n=1 Tax=Micromonospora kangleipakensis TaxID=1077942 RepID=A0A4Q8BHZ5_9ACTN|nr:PAS domain S-box protein [Micromonospora kangleipakensis]RZU77131.1 PAS domain S-box-containing protein [Micromonospora kangleipakensis]
MSGSAPAGTPPDSSRWQDVFAAGGEMGAAIADHDWTAPLGPIDSWPQSLRTALTICLHSRFPMLLLWGDELVMLYNDAFRPILGLSKRDALGRPAAAVWPEIWDVIGPMLTDVLAGRGATWNQDQLLLLDRNGFVEEVYFTFSYSPIIDESGAPGGVFTVVTETTERVVSERRLRLLSTLTAGLVDATAPEEVGRRAVKALAGSPAVPFVRLYLAGEDGLRPVHGNEAGAPAGAEESWPLAEVLASGEPRLLPLDPTDDPDRPGTPLVAVVPVPEPGAAAPTAVLIAGLNPRRPVDADYRAFVDLLAGHIGTALAGARAYQAEHRRAEALAELDAAKSAFFANVSHELRTPLTLIAGPVRDALTDPAQPLPEPLRRRLELVDRNAARLHRLVDSVLDFTRIEAGRLVPDRVALDVARFTRELAAAFAPAIERAGLTFEVDCARLPRPAYLDRVMWEKVVLNLLSNALKATVTGTIRLAVADDGGRLRLTVSDTGVGIPADELPRLFQRFHRVTGPAGRSAEGSGIGLALVRELVALHGGQIEVASAAGEGATFTVRIPYGSGSDAAAAGTAVSAAPTTAAAALADELGGPAGPGEVTGPPDAPRVVLVDDNPDLRAYVTELLAPHFGVRTAGDGRAALAAIVADPPDLVLADVMMPHLDGFGLLAALRADPRTADLPVVLLSARAGPEAAVEGLAAGADDYLVKPFSASELLARVRANLARARARLRRGEWATQVVESITDGVWVADENGVVFQVDETFERLTGYGQADAPYPPPYPWWPDPVTHPEERALLDRALVHLLGERTGAWEVPFQHRDGRTHWVSVSATEVRDPEHDRTLLVGTVRDVTAEHAVTQRHRAAAALADRLAEVAAEDEVLALTAAALSQAFAGTAYLLPRDGDGPAHTAAGPVAVAELDPTVAARLARPGDDEGTDAAVFGVGGRLSTPTRAWAVWVAFAAPRAVRADERMLGGLLTAAGSQALRRVEAVRQQHALTDGLRDAVREATERERAWRAEAAARADQQRAEAAARRTATVSEALLDSAPVGVGLVDTELRYLLVNPALAAMNRLPAADHLGRRPSECLPVYEPRIEELMRRALAHGPIVGVEFTAEAAPPATGRQHVVASYFPIRIADTGELVGLGFTIVDVTERTRLLEALGAERARHERLAATDVLAVFGGEEERITEANEAFLALLGYTAEDVARGRLTLSDLTPPGWEEADARALAELTESGRARAYDKEYRHADGRRVPVQIGVVALERKPLRWLAYATDLSAERAAQAELRLFQALVERSGDFIAVATPDGRAVYVNPAGRQLVGLGEVDRVDGLGLVDFAAPDVREVWRRELIPTALREGQHRAESRLVRLDTGEQFEVEHQTFTVTTGDGRDSTAFVATVARDIGDRQRALRQAEGLARLAGALSSARGRAAIVDVVTTVVPSVVGAAALRVAIAPPGALTLDVAGGGDPAGQLPVEADEPLARAVRDNVVLPVDPAGGRTAGICLPLRYGDGGALGALEVRWARPVADDEALRNLLHAVAGLCSQALQRAELTGSAQAMADFAARLSVARSTTEAVEVILTAAPIALGAALPGLAIHDEGRRIRLWYNDEVPTGLAATYRDLMIDDPRPIARALRTGERIILRNRAEFAARFPGLPDPVGAHGMVTTVALPLFDAQRRPIAALGFGWRRERSLRESDLTLLDTLADLCEQTLERVRLAAAEHNLVTRLAGRLRSSARSTPSGLEIATRYQPAMSGLHLGGDWYDLVRLDQDRLAVVVGDVVGHRVEAAADMAQLRTMLNTLIRLGVPLEEVLLRLTDLLGVGFLGTCLVMVVDPVAGEVRVARAGHPHPVLLPRGRPAEPVHTVNALPMGMVDEPMTVTTVPFGPGDLLVAYTDGLVERRERAYDEGVAALHRAVEAVRDRPVEAIADALLADLAGGEDDQALVVIRHVG